MNTKTNHRGTESQSKAQHTPGPWEYQAGTIGNYSAGVIAMMPPKPESAANANLIAAAPELLEACEYVVKWHREHDSGAGELFGQDFITTCISAIRKAHGEL